MNTPSFNYRYSLFTIVYLVVIFISPRALSEPPINTLEKTGLFKYRHGEIAINGYDTVAYFTQSTAVKGISTHTITWRGANWMFSSAKHQALFLQEPDRYAPQYGGYCAYGIAEGYLAKIDGNQWSIIDDKLYLNYSKKFLKRWQKNPNEYINRANERFDILLKE